MTASSYYSENGFSREQMERLIPSAFTPNPHPKMSERYQHIPTGVILDAMMSEGFIPVTVSQVHARKPGDRGYEKHLIRLRHSELGSVSDDANELVLVNSLNGSTCYELMLGSYRFVCANGLISGNTSDMMKVKHRGDNDIDAVLSASYDLMGGIEELNQFKSELKTITLDEYKKLAYARACIEMRWGEESPVTPHQILQPRRRDDNSNDLWTVYNVVQENLIKGGLRGVVKDKDGNLRRRRTRSVSNITESVAINRGLSRLAQELANMI